MKNENLFPLRNIISLGYKAYSKHYSLFKILTLAFILSTLTLVQMRAQVPQGFNYQAIARDAANNAISNRALPVRMTVQTSLVGGTVIWQETQTVTTNPLGILNLVIGRGTRTGGSASLFSDISWGTQPLFLKTEIQYPAQDYLVMGTSELLSVPYSMVAKDIQGPLSKLGVTGKTNLFDEALFEVKNNTGQTVFAVYNEGIRAYVDNGAKGGKGGFAIGGFGTAKAGAAQTLLTVSPDSVRIYVDETVAKGNKGGFAIGGFNAAKGTINEFMMMTPDNYFIGHRSGQLVTSGIYNSTLGFESGKSLLTGSNNVFLGYKSGTNTAGGGSNVLIGTEAGKMNTSGYYNIFLGRQAGYSNTASSNIFVGDLSAYYNTTGNQNVIIGDWAGYHNTTGLQNVILGANAGWFNTTGSNNIFMGFESGYNNTTGFDNINIGNKAGKANIDGTYNVMIGSDAGTSNANGDYNTLIGYKSGEKTTANYGTMLGYLAGNSNTSGQSQVMLGYMAGSANTGSYNTYVGTLAGGTGTTGNYNTYVGLAAGNAATGDNNVFIGKWSGWYETGSDKLYIENSSGSTPLIWGDFNLNRLRLNGNTSINGASANQLYALEINRDGDDTYGLVVYGATFCSSGVWAGSDVRLKRNIVPLSNSLNKVLTLNGVNFDWKIQEFPEMGLPKERQIGFIAQDVEKVLPELVNEGPNGYKSVDYTKITPVLVEALKEQQVLINNQKSEIELLKSELEMIKALLLKNGIK